MTEENNGMTFADGFALILGIVIAVVAILACIGKYARNLSRTSGGLVSSNEY